MKLWKILIRRGGNEGGGSAERKGRACAMTSATKRRSGPTVGGGDRKMNKSPGGKRHLVTIR